MVSFLFFPIFKALLPFCERTVFLVNLENVRAYEEEPLKICTRKFVKIWYLFIWRGERRELIGEKLVQLFELRGSVKKELLGV